MITRRLIMSWLGLAAFPPGAAFTQTNDREREAERVHVCIRLARAIEALRKVWNNPDGSPNRDEMWLVAECIINPEFGIELAEKYAGLPLE